MLEIFRISLSHVIMMIRMTLPVIPNVERTEINGNRICRINSYSSKYIDFQFSIS